MNKPHRTTHVLVRPVNGSLYDLPAPPNISYLWNFGSLLGLILGVQLVTGLFLAIHYIPFTDSAFSSATHITRDVNAGWLIRLIHINGASAFFLFLYLHIGRGIYYGSHSSTTEAWNIGVIIYIASIATAFLGYVLPWGQISFWAATVITNIFSAIPIIGYSLVEWLWGGFAVENPTLNRFFALHFTLPFIISALVFIHVVFLHRHGSSNPLGTNRDRERISFHPFYSSKDLLGFIIALCLLLFLTCSSPNLFNDPENFIPANPLITPPHIKPEWYFLWLYAILRSIPNKLGGVLALFSAILIPMTIALMVSPNSNKSDALHSHSNLLFWTLFSCFAILSWVGSRPVEPPYIIIGQLTTTLYFIFFMWAPAHHKNI